MHDAPSPHAMQACHGERVWDTNFPICWWRLNHKTPFHKKVSERSCKVGEGYLQNPFQISCGPKVLQANLKDNGCGDAENKICLSCFLGEKQMHEHLKGSKISKDILRGWGH